MKFKAVVLVLLLCTGVAYGQTQEGKHTSFTIGAQAYSYTYEEPDLGVKDEGWMYGISYALTYENLWVFSLEGVLATGEVDYTQTGSGTLDGQDNFLADTRGLIGYKAYNKTKTISTLLFSGIAYRYLSNESEGKQTNTGLWGYDRRSYYLYSPVGVKLDFVLQQGWHLVATLEYDLFWKGEQESDLGYMPGYDDISNNQDSGNGYRLSLAFSKMLKPNRSLSIEPFYRCWEIDNSDLTVDSSGQLWIEPENETREYGINISFTF